MDRCYDRNTDYATAQNVYSRRRHIHVIISHYLLLRESIRTSFFLQKSYGKSFFLSSIHTKATEHFVNTQRSITGKSPQRTVTISVLKSLQIFFCTYFNDSDVASPWHSHEFLCLTRINSLFRHLTTSGIIGELRCLFGTSADQSLFTPRSSLLSSFTYYIATF